MHSLIKDDVLYQQCLKQHSEHIDKIKQTYRSSLKKRMTDAASEYYNTQVMQSRYLPKMRLISPIT